MKASTVIILLFAIGLGMVDLGMPMDNEPQEHGESAPDANSKSPIRANISGIQRGTSAMLSLRRSLGQVTPKGFGPKKIGHNAHDIRW